MRKLLFIAVLLVTSVTVSAQSKPKSGYLGKRLIICAEGSYSPNYHSIRDLLLSYNLQYGGNIHFITGRFSQVGVSYNMYGLGAHERYRDDISNANKIKGYQVGVSYRKFREKRGGLAPIGKFVDLTMYYHSNTYSPSLIGVAPYMGEPIKLTGVSAQIGFGTQGIYWKRVVANAGVRFGYPIYTVAVTGGDSFNLDYPQYMKQRLLYKDVFSAYFGVGFIL